MAAFGWSVGDCITACILIKDVIIALNDSRGSVAEYNEICRELWSLDRALLEVHQVAHNSEKTIQLNALQQTVGRVAAQCKDCIEVFLKKIKGFQSSLRVKGSGNILRDAVGKIKWSMTQKDELTKFRAEINTHASAINMLLITASINVTTLASKTVENKLADTDRRHEISSNQQLQLLGDIQQRIEVQGTAVTRLEEGMHSFLAMSPELQTFMTTMCESTLSNYKILIDVQHNLPKQTGPCWIQEPVTLTDPLGRVAPIHLELINSWHVFESVLAARFLCLPGQRKLKRREYSLQGQDATTDLERSRPFDACFTPGGRVGMCFNFEKSFPSNACPTCKKETDTSASSTTQCVGCGLWFQRVEEVIDIESNPVRPVLWNEDPQKVHGPQAKRRRCGDNENEDEDEDVRQFKRVRLIQKKYENKKKPYGNISTTNDEPPHQGIRSRRNNKRKPRAERSSLGLGAGQKRRASSPPRTMADEELSAISKTVEPLQNYVTSWLTEQELGSSLSSIPFSPRLDANSGNLPIPESLPGLRSRKISPSEMSWGGVSVGSWIRDDIIMAGTSPFSHQSPSYHSSSDHLQTGTQSMRDFSCCGETLPTLHDLFQHYEDSHVEETPQSPRTTLKNP